MRTGSMLIAIAVSICVPTLASGIPTGTALWRSGSSTVPLENPWNGSSFGTSDSTVAVGAFRIMAGAEAPTRDEKTLIGINSDGDVAMMIWNGTIWTAPPFSPMASVSESFWWGCDVAYMHQSGDAVVVWNNGSSGTDCISYRTGNSLAWSAEDTITVPLAGEPQHMHLAASPTSDEMVLVVSNESSQDYAIVWDGSTWGNAEVLDNSGAGDNRTDICVAYQQMNGHAMVVFGRGLPAIYYSVWNGSVWSSATNLAKPFDASGNARWTTLAADPRSDRIALGVLTPNQDVWLCVWDDSTWGTPQTATNSATGTGYPGVAVAFEGLSGEGVAVYGEGSQVQYRTWSEGAGWSGDLLAAVLGGSPNSMTLDAVPGSDRLMLSVQDGNSDLNYVHWDGGIWGAPDELEVNTGEVKNQPFLFLWDIDITDGTSYYVSPSGDDDNDGLTPGTAWISLDRGDQLAVLAPGDTVNVLPGTYHPGRRSWLTSSGNAASPVTYRKLGEGAAVFEMNWIAESVLLVDGDHVVIDGLETTESGHHGMYIRGDSCVVTNCYVHTNAWDGVNVEGDGNTIYRNAIANCGWGGIYNKSSGDKNLFFNNTVHSCTMEGLYMAPGVSEARILNNIVTSNDFGIVGEAGNVCGYNDVWNNASGNYGGGVSDSAGGISGDPLYADPAADDFGLLPGSPAINTGLDLGYPYKGPAPDMGALESTYSRSYYASPSGDDDNDGLSEAAPWLSIHNGDVKGILVPGDTVNVLPGIYTPTTSIYLTTDGTGAEPLTYRKYGSSSAVIDFGGGSKVAMIVEGDHVRLDSIEITNTTEQGVHVKADSCTVRGMYVHDIGKEGFRVEGHYNVFLRNIVAFSLEEGFKNEGSGEYNAYYNNTVYSNGKIGFDMKDNTSRVFNSIVALNEKGINGDGSNVCGFNNVWGNASGNYTGGVADSAGGISVEPGLIDPVSGDFGLANGSLEIDAGLDLGYPYKGAAPDMGAVEWDSPDSIAYIEVSPQTVSVDEGTSRQFNAYGYGVDSLFVEDLTDSVTWSMDDPSGSVTSGGLYTAGHDLSPPDYYVTATYAAMSDSGAVTVVTDGTLSYVLVELEDGTPFPDTTLTTDNDTTLLYCRGYDSGDNPIGDESVDWDVLGEDSIGTVSPAVGTSTTLTLSRPGTGQIEAVSSPAIKDTSGVITCMAGGPAELVVSPDSSTVSADSTLQFASVSYDADGNETSPQLTVTWEVIGGIGSIDGTGLFTATTAGTGDVAAAGSGLADTTGMVEVLPGEVDSLTITPNVAAISADSTQQFVAWGFDGDGNAVGPLGVLTWEVLGDIGTIDTTGLFTAVNAGTGFMKVCSDLGPCAETDTITVVPGAVLSIDVLPSSQVVVEGTSYQFTALAYDSDSNLVLDATEQAAWNTTDPLGSVTASGLYTAGEYPSPPLYHVWAQLSVPLGSLSYVRDSSEVTVITDGALEYVRIEHSDGSEFGDMSLTTDIDTTKLFCRGYDSSEGLIGDIAVDWYLIGEDSIGSVSAGPSAYTTLLLTKAGTGRVTAVYNDDLVDTTGLITCAVGAPAYLIIEPDTATLAAGTSLQFSTRTLDADGNPSSLITVDAWDVIGGIGSISNGGLFHATVAGIGQVACSGEGLEDTTGPIAILPGPLARMEVSPDSTEVTLGSRTGFESLGFDSYSNPANVGTLTWSVVGGIGTIDESGIFTATGVGSGRIAAASNIGGVTDTSSLVIVNPSNLDMIVVAPDTAMVGISDGLQFSARGFDADFDPIDFGLLTWEVLGGIGTIDTSGMFTATNAGIGRVAATSNIDGIADTTKMIVVEVPSVTGLPIGNMHVHAGQLGVPILAFRISNPFDSKETIQAVTIRDASAGSGNSAQIRSNMDTLALYVDSDESGGLSPSDVLLAGSEILSDDIELSFSPVTIGPGVDRTFIATANITRYPRDGDSLDMYLSPAADIETGSGRIVAGPETINSLGYCILDGLTAAQVGLVPTGTSTIAPLEGTAHVLTIEIPRNGYSDDVLEILSVLNAGTADTVDIDSLYLYMDTGNRSWDGPDNESKIGNLSFTGDHWEISGLSVALNEQTQMFFLGARLGADAQTGRSLSFGIPLHGIEMGSSNDGPIDEPVGPVETITIAAPEMISVRVLPIAGRELIHGEGTGPLVGIEFANGYPVPVGIDSITFVLEAQDPDGAPQDVLDAQLGSVELWLNRDPYISVRGPADSLIGSADLTDGAALLRVGSLLLPAGCVKEVFIESSLDPVNSKNGNIINFSVISENSIHFALPAQVTGGFPLINAEDFSINIFQAASVALHPVASTRLFGNQPDQLVLDFGLPRNGYDDDVLESLRIQNTGSTAGLDALSGARLWADPNDNGLSGDETLLGDFEYDEGTWLIDGLSYPLTDSGNRFLVTVDVESEGFEGGTVRFEIPVQGIQYHSGTDGPDDRPVGNPVGHLLFPANRITVIPIPQDATVTEPGATSIEVLTFALYNGYMDRAHVLETVRLSNRTRSVSTDEFADYELGQVSFHYDQDGNREFHQDSLLATGYFSDSELSLSGLNIVLAAESLAYFFVTADLPLDIIDSDTLDITIQETSDFTFAETVNINGNLPVSRGGELVVDGSVLRQYEVLDVALRTLSPGDQSIPVLAFRPAVNGDRIDTLFALTVTNAADAEGNDIESLWLYLDDNGDDTWQPVDQLLGQAEYDGSEWKFNALNLEVEGSPAALFLVADIADQATPNRVLQAVIPTGGCEYGSDNDGPRDAAITAAQAFIISSSGFRVTYHTPRSAYSVGQGVPIEVSVTNLMPVGLNDVSCGIVLRGQPSILRLDGSFVGPSEIESGETAVFSADYTAIEPGEIFWEVQAFSPALQESSAVVRTEPVTIQSAPASVDIDLISSIPTSVTKGQSRVFPMSIKCRHSDGSPLAAPMRLDSLRLRVLDENGDPQDADQVFSRMVLATGYTNLAILDQLPPDADVVLAFDQPAILSPGTEQILSLRVDIDSAATVDYYALGLEDEDAARFVDINSGLPVPVAGTGNFPLRTATCRINNPSQNLAVSYLPTLGEFSNYGQPDVDVMSIILRHPGRQDDSQIQFTGISFQFFDDEYRRIPVTEIFDEIRLTRQQSVIGDLNDVDYGDTSFTVWLSAPPVLSPGEVDTVKLAVSLKAESPHSSFGVLVKDSTLFVLRDLSSGALVNAISDTWLPTTSATFPMRSGFSRLKYQALEPEVCVVSPLPQSVIAGSDSVVILDVNVSNPAGYSNSDVWLGSVRLSVTDSMGVPVDPHALFDRIGVRLTDGQVTYESSIGMEAGFTVFHAGPAGVSIGPGESASVALIADIEPDTPYDHIKLWMFAENGLELLDATDRNRKLGLAEPASCAGTFPFATGAIHIYLPAGSPRVKAQKLPAQIGFPGQSGLTALLGELVYSSVGPEADLILKGWRGKTLKRTASGLVPVPAREVFSAVHLLLNDEVVAVDTVLTGDGILLEPQDEYLISRGEVKTIRLTCDITPKARAGNFVIGFDDSSFAEFMDRSLLTTIHPVLVGDDYPLLTADVSITGASLVNSFTNWPNPFNPNYETTTIGYVLKEQADVDIEIFTLMGDLVKRVAIGAHRPAGSNDRESWNGTNDRGSTVIPGTYICRVTVRYVSGGTEEARRMMAVVR
ncbi:MAG: right-handed parallel beta-helix repeat-containing protein [Candidatus Eisenbacteria bacterium]